MVRLFSTFSRGWPAAGLLLMRIVAAIELIVDAVNKILTATTRGFAIQDVLAAAAGILLFLGLWTPIVGALAAILELLAAFSQNGDPWVHVLVATLGAALALLGPGTWSVDARLFGWKLIDLTDRRP